MTTFRLYPRKIDAKTFVQIVTCLSFLLLVSGMLVAQTVSPPATCAPAVDPGLQGGSTPDAGGPISTLNTDEKTFWKAAQGRFETVFSVSGTITGEPGVGLGPAFNGNSCALCHSQPAVGGTSPAVNPLAPPFNTLDGATNTEPSFITASGPAREARFILNPDGTADGSVHEIFSIKGRTDSQGCALKQPNFATEIAEFNVINRIPTPLFGVGLVENVSEDDLWNNLNANATAKANDGIAGKFNISGNDNTITRFGWKAQNKSLLIFAGEAENVEMGITNEAFPDEKFPNRNPDDTAQPSNVAGCDLNPTPEDITNGVIGPPPTGPSGNEASDVSSNTINLAGFMRLNAPPAPITTFPLTNGATAAQVATGATLFKSVGCNLCHTESFTTQASPFGDAAGDGLNQVTFSPFSDFELHHMGSTLADGITQGNAGPDEFRTAPLWGLAQRIFLLHDGRTTDLMAAIQDHVSSTSDCVDGTTTQDFEVVFNIGGVTEVSFDPTETDQFCGSEANTVIANFNALTNCQQQDILDFLRTL
jgi:CxxC motif-containing protein (DUF1111 family)